MSEMPQAGAEAPQPFLSLDRVFVELAGNRVLQDISLEVQRGQTLVVIGESGCGKTVLLKAIIGLLRPKSGQVTLDGKVLGRMSEKDLSRERLRFGFLFQGAALFDSLTVYDNVAFGLRG